MTKLSILAALSIPSVVSGAVSFTHTFNPTVSDRYIASDREGRPWYAQSSTSLPASFTQNFTGLGEEVWSVTFAAPGGQRFKITAPLGWDDTSVSIRWNGGSNSVRAGSFSDTSASFGFGGGTTLPAPLIARMSLTGPGASDSRATWLAIADFQLTPGQTSYFDSLTLSTTVPASYSGVFSNVRGSFSITTTTSSPTSEPDPGPALSIVPVSVPEPSVGLLGIIAMGGMFLRRKR